MASKTVLETPNWFKTFFNLTEIEMIMQRYLKICRMSFVKKVKCKKEGQYFLCWIFSTQSLLAEISD